MNRKQVEDTLIRMGMPAAVKGFKYIVDAIMCMDSGEWNGSIVGLYESVAEEFNTTATSVERAIRHAFDRVRNNGDFEMVSKYIGFTNEANGNSLNMLYMRIKSEEEPKQETKSEVTTVDEDFIRQIVRDELRRMVG